MTTREQARRLDRAERRWIADARARLSRARLRRTTPREEPLVEVRAPRASKPRRRTPLTQPEESRR